MAVGVSFAASLLALALRLLPERLHER